MAKVLDAVEVFDFASAVRAATALMDELSFKGAPGHRLPAVAGSATPEA
jgi:hypothetical protein